MVFVFCKNNARIKLVLGKCEKRFFYIFFLFAVFMNCFVGLGNSISFDEFIDSYENYNSSDFVLKNSSYDIIDDKYVDFNLDFENSQGDFLVVYNLYELGNFSLVESDYRLNLFCKKSSYFNSGINNLDFNYSLFFLENEKSYLPKIDVYLDGLKIYSKNLDVISGSDFNNLDLEIDLGTFEFVKDFDTGSYYEINSLCYYLKYNESLFENNFIDGEDNINDDDNSSDNNVSDDNTNDDSLDSSDSISGSSCSSSGSSGGGSGGSSSTSKNIPYNDINYDPYFDTDENGLLDDLSFDENISEIENNLSLTNLNSSEDISSENLEEQDLDDDTQRRIETSEVYIDDNLESEDEETFFGKIVVGVGVVVMGLLGMILLA